VLHAFVRGGEKNSMLPERHNEERGAAHRAPLRYPARWSPADRHVILGVSHPSDDPSRHRTFEIRAVYDATRDGWIARAGEQNLNEQRGDWMLVEPGDGPPPVFASAAECLGHAVTTIIAAVDRDADQE
jgi:hypothetical protein